MSVSRTSGAIDSIGAAWCVRSRWARTSSTTFSGVRSTQGPTMRSVSGSLDASISMHAGSAARARSRRRARRRCRSGCAGSPSRACPAGPRCALPAHRHPGRRCRGRRRPRRCHRCSRHRRTAASAAAIRPGRPDGSRGGSAELTGGRLTAVVASAPVRFGPPGEDHMALRVVGAGLGRTGTASLQLALQQLLDGRCYHMGETFGRPDDIPVWHAAVNGSSPDWDAFLADYVATVDWPACAFWRELADANPDAIVLLSTRSSADAWWKSANDTIFQISTRDIPADAPPMFGARSSRWSTDMFANTFTPDWERRDRGQARRTRRTTRRVRADRRPGPPRRVATGRRLGTDRGRARRRRCRRSVPPREHHRRLPRHDRPRLTAPSNMRRLRSRLCRNVEVVRRGGGGRRGSAGRPDRAGCRGGATRPARGRRRSTRRARSRRCRWRR